MFVQIILKTLEDAVKQEFIRIVKEIKALYGISNSEVAKSLGMDRSKMSRLVSGPTKPSITLLKDLKVFKSKLAEQVQGEKEVASLPPYAEDLIAEKERLIESLQQQIKRLETANVSLTKQVDSLHAMIDRNEKVLREQVSKLREDISELKKRS